MFCRMFASMLFIPLACGLLPVMTQHVLAQQVARGNPSLICKPASASSLRVTLRRQEMDNWCWAASAQMVMEYLGKPVSQCIQANDRLGRKDCCNNPQPDADACDQTGWPEFGRYGFHFQQTMDNVQLSWLQVKNELAPRDGNNLCNFTPFAFAWRWLGGGGHMMVAHGYYTDANGGNWIEVDDPLQEYGPIVSYEDFVKAPDHTHWRDYYDVKQ